MPGVGDLFTARFDQLFPRRWMALNLASEALEIFESFEVNEKRVLLNFLLQSSVMFLVIEEYTEDNSIFTTIILDN